MKEQIDAFVKAADEVAAKYWADMKFTYAPPPIHRAETLSDKWVRVITIDREHGGAERNGGVYAFIALKDHETKGLGKVRAGGIHKADGYKRAAKHERGNVFEDDFRKCLTRHGIVYLR